MTEPRTGSRYELEIEDAGAAESKSHDYYEVLPGDLEEADEEDDLIGYVHSWEVGSTVDGPGLRFVGFLTGCLLRCQYCHNPDTWHKKNGHPVTVSRAMQQIGKYVKVLKISKGGVTLSGGEPMLQRPFTMRIFRRCKALGLHTCMDTSGRLGDKFGVERPHELAEVPVHRGSPPGLTGREPVPGVVRFGGEGGLLVRGAVPLRQPVRPRLRARDRRHQVVVVHAVLDQPGRPVCEGGFDGGVGHVVS